MADIIRRFSNKTEIEHVKFMLTDASTNMPLLRELLSSYFALSHHSQELKTFWDNWNTKGSKQKVLGVGLVHVLAHNRLLIHITGQEFSALGLEERQATARVEFIVQIANDQFSIIDVDSHTLRIVETES